MACKQEARLKWLPLIVMMGLYNLPFGIAAGPAAGATANRPPLIDSSHRSGHPPASQQESSRTEQPASGGKKPRAGTAAEKKTPKPSAVAPSDRSAKEEKKARAFSLVEGVLLSSGEIKPVEYKALAEVEAATLLWASDRERAISTLKSALQSLRAALAEKKESTVINSYRESAERRVWFLVIRKIAALAPNLVSELLAEESHTNQVRGEWTEDARALMSVAFDLVEKDPKLAARLAGQSLFFGLAYWQSFLNAIHQRDSSEAERLAYTLIDRLKESSVNPIEFRNMGPFVIADERPPALKQHYFQAVAARIRRDLRPDATPQELKDSLYTAQVMNHWVASYSGTLQQEFGNLAYTLEMMLNERSVPLPGPGERITIDMSSLRPAQPGDTGEVREGLRLAEATKNAKARDSEYQKLAVKAAMNADVGLAEEVLAKIENEQARRETSLKVYNPLVQKEVSESDWAQAQKLASKVLDPVDRALVFNYIARSMATSKADRALILDLYDGVAMRLNREDPTDRVAKAFLVVCKSLYPVDRDRGLEALKSFAYVLNKMINREEPFQESVMRFSGPTIYVPTSNRYLLPEDALNLADLTASTFKEVARQDVEGAISVAYGIKHRGLYSMAQLAIAGALLDEVKRLPEPKPQRKTPAKSR